MQRNLMSAVYRCCLFMALFPAALSAQHDRCALLVGVGDYPAETGWHKLAAKNDVALMKGVLSDHGFPETGIATLLDAGATRPGILQAIADELVAKAAPGGTALFYFSGHGQQVQDDNGDEVDGLDEALVPFDSPKHYLQGKYEGERLLRDDDLGSALMAVRRKLGPEGILLVLLDACHSGSGTRGPQVVARGTDIVMASPEWLANLDKTATDGPRLAATGGHTDDGDLAPMVALFSSGPHQLSYERQDDNGQACGSFTYAFCKGMQRLAPDATYRGLLDKIILEVSAVTYRQSPLAEGPVDRKVFGKGLLPVPAYFPVLLEYPFDSLLVVRAGRLQGMHPGSKVALHAAGTSDTTTVSPLALGTVEHAAPFEADVRLDRQLPPGTDAKSLRVFLRERSYGIPTLRVQSSLTDKELERRLKADLTAYPFLEIVDSSGALYLEAPSGLAGRSLQLYQSGDQLLWSAPLNENSAENMAREMALAAARYLRASYLSTLELAHPNIRADIVLLEQKPDGSFSPMEPRRPLRLKEKIKLQVKNTGTQGFYFRLFDIQPDHAISTLVPYKKLPPADFRLEPGGVYDFPVTLTVNQPTGTDVLKIIATSEALDLDFSRSRDRSNDRSGFSYNPLEWLLGDLTGATPNLRSNSETMPNTVGFVGSLLLEIVE